MVYKLSRSVDVESHSTLTQLTVSLTTLVSLRQLNVRKINKPSWSKAGELTIFDGFKMWRILNNNHETSKLFKINQKQ
jgi:hypothetical protein